MIKAVIFDMDGLLVDSEPLWEIAKMRVFPRVGVPMTRELSAQMIGLRSDEAVLFLNDRFPWEAPSLVDVEKELLDTMADLLRQQTSALPGALSVIGTLREAGMPMAIASSSPQRIIDIVLKELGIFEDMVVSHSAELESHGKPHPAVYLTTARQLGVRPEECLALEDSGNGVLAAKSAKMQCIAVPSEAAKSDKLIQIADMAISSLADFTLSMLTTSGLRA
ncbi:hexitol phosphatase HxpB [Streptomyces sp. NPDC088748]|uniref:hexitol phosphatase HxpB n=1 Tax=Streptomyces sp. NPDC088748 TaxID=3365887 RepID=UPI00380C6373